MPRNIEIKARVADPEALGKRAAGLADEGPCTIEQDDTFLACAGGRLKLRDFGDGRGELIFYRRPNREGPAESDYRITPTADPAGLRATLSHALGVIGRVRKRRKLFLVGRTRIHIDTVAGLGEFMELEVVLDDGEPAAAGEAEARELMRRLGVSESDRIAVAYVDLVAESDSH